MTKLIALLIAFWVCQPIVAQVVIDSDSTHSTGVRTYLLNNGSYFRHSTDYTKSGLVYPRDGGDGFVFGAGVLIGAQLNDESEHRITRVLQSYHPISGESMCVPGHYRDGNLFRPDLQELYAVKRQRSESFESLSSTFHDGDLRVYPRHIDTNAWSQLGMPFGFQFDQRMVVWSSSEVSNIAIVETTVRYIGERRLDSICFCSVTDVAIGQSEDAMFADMGDYCVIEDRDKQYPFIVARSTMDGARRFGTLGVGLLPSDLIRRLDGIRIIRADMVGDGSLHRTSYSLMSDGVVDDSLPAGDKIVLLAVLVGDLVKGDSFKIYIGYVVATTDVVDPTIEIRNKLGRLRSELTTIDRDLNLVIDNRFFRQVVQGDALQLPEEYRAIRNVTIVTTLAEKSVVEVRQGFVDLTGLRNGYYVVVDSTQQSSLHMKFVLMR